MRRRLLGVLFAGSGIARLGYIAAFTVSSLVAEDLLGSASLAGMPNAAATIGLAMGTAPIAALMARAGRRAGISVGLVTGSLGILVAAVAIGFESFLLFVTGMFIFGFGAAGDRLSRYAAADISTPERRSFSIAIVVWAGTIGSIVGPIVLEPAKRAAEGLGLDGLAGPTLLAALTFGAAAALVFFGLRPDPLEFASADEKQRARDWKTLAPLTRQAAVRYSIAALVVGQFVMVMIMTMTPVHVRRAGEGLGIVGIVIGAHTFGMFAVSPLTGLLSDRLGRLPVMIAGQVILVIAAFTAASSGADDRVMLTIALFLLGLGWNFGFVAGSAYLTEGAPPRARVALQGMADTLVWSSGAVAGFSSGFVLEGTSYATLCLIASTLVAVPVVLILRYRRDLGTRVPALERG